MKNFSNANASLVCFQANPEAKLRIFCCPYVGGGIQVFRDWHKELASKDLEIYALQLPGRGMRLREPAFENMSAVVPEVVQAISPLIMNKPYIFFGHSMGSLVSFEAIRALRKEGKPEPNILIASGRRAPEIIDPDPPVHALPREKFIQELKRLNGTPKEILENEDFLDLILPTLQADFAVCETYQFEKAPPFHFPIHALGGLSDPKAPQKDMEPWGKHTLGNFELTMLEGDHFFLHGNSKCFFETMNGILEKVLREL